MYITHYNEDKPETRRMKFNFTKHAIQKFALLRKVKFPISKRKVRLAIISPTRLEKGREGALIATKILDEEYALRVVYKHSDDIITIITFYPVRRIDYEI